MCKETYRATTCLLADQYVPNFIWNDTESDGDYRPINIPLTDVESLREEMPLDAEPIEYISKYFTGEVTDIICKETNRYAEQYIETNAAISGQNQLFMIANLQIGMK